MPERISAGERRTNGQFSRLSDGRSRPSFSFMISKQLNEPTTTTTAAAAACREAFSGNFQPRQPPDDVGREKAETESIRCQTRSGQARADSTRLAERHQTRGPLFNPLRPNPTDTPLNRSPAADQRWPQGSTNQRSPQGSTGRPREGLGRPARTGLIVAEMAENWIWRADKRGAERESLAGRSTAQARHLLHNSIV